MFSAVSCVVNCYIAKLLQFMLNNDFTKNGFRKRVAQLEDYEHAR